MRPCMVNTRHPPQYSKLLNAANGCIPTSSSLPSVPSSILSQHHPNIKITTNINSYRKDFLSRFPHVPGWQPISSYLDAKGQESFRGLPRIKLEAALTGPIQR